MTDLQYFNWQVSTENFDDIDYNESIFFSGNGYMGARGFFCEDISNRPHQKGIAIAGVFELLKDNITDIVNTPNIFYSTIEVDGEILNISECIKTQSLHLNDGVIEYNYVAEFGQKKIKITVSRFFRLDDVHGALVRVNLTPLNFEGNIKMRTGIDNNIYNMPIHDDQLKKNDEIFQYINIVEMGCHDTACYSHVKTEKTNISIWESFEISIHDNVESFTEVNIEKDISSISKVIEFQGKEGITFTIDKFISVFTSRDVDKTASKECSIEHCQNQLKNGFEHIYKSHGREWENRWKKADIQVDGNIKVQAGIRYNIFQLITNNSRDDTTVSIGARGLTHTRYKGCYFWDTDIFLLPFYVSTDPIAAKNLLLYRYNTLEAAKEHAKKMSSVGARYPWMTSFDGSEQCETWDIGSCEIHVTPDVAFSFDYYIKATGDKEFLYNYATEVYIETSRFLADRFSYYKEKDIYNLLFVKGPDEYCGATSNNTYTNWLSIYTMKLALSAIKDMEENCPNRLEKLLYKCNVQDSEKILWSEIIQKAVILYDDKEKLYLPDENFHLLEPFDISDYKKDDTPLYHKICFDRLQRYKVIKQADILLLMCLFPNEFTLEQKKIAWNVYEPLTLHDSTLSFGVHALLAAQIDLYDESDTYLQKSLFLDLDNIMKNTAKEGLHIAAFGVTWQALVFGYGNNTDKLPSGWKVLHNML